MFIALVLSGVGVLMMGTAPTVGIVGFARSAAAPKRHFPKYHYGITAFR